MPRNQKKQIIYCLEHEFSLIPLKSDLYLKQTATLSFCRGKILSKNKNHRKKNENQENCSCCPIFNKDKNHATNSFILPQQQENFIENSQKLKLEHDCRVYQYNDQKSKIFIPKPKSRYSYCNVCRTSYQDYLEHIQNQTHKNHINKSRFNNYIKELMKKYDRKQRIKRNLQKSNEATSTTFYHFPQSQLENQELGKPTKKVKVSKEEYQINNKNKTQPNSGFSSIPMQHFGSNIFYQSFSYQPFPQISLSSLSMLPNLDHDFGSINPLNYHINYMMYGNPSLYWNSYYTFYPNMHYPPQYRPLIIDLQQKQD